MKYIKILICILLISLGLVFQGEEYQSYINSLAEFYPMLCLQYDEVEINDVESVINDIVKKSEKYNVELFSECDESKSKTCKRHTLYISDTSVKEKLYKDNYVREGTFGSFLSGDFSVSYKSFDDITDTKNIYSFNIIGTDENAYKFANAVMKKYDFFSYGSGYGNISNQESEVLFLWTAIGIIILSLTTFEIVSKKKEFSVRWCFGEKREKTVLINILSDIAVFIGLYLILGKLISYVTPCGFMYSRSLMILAAACMINTVFWTALLFLDIKNSIKGKEINRGSLVFGVLTKVFVSTIGMILLSDFLISSFAYASLYNQMDFFEENKNYSYVSLAFHNDYSGGTNRDRNELKFYRNVFSKADARIQFNIGDTFGFGNGNVLYFNKNSEKYLFENLKMEDFKLEDRTLYTFIPERYKTKLTDTQIHDFNKTVTWLIDSSDGLTYNYETVYYPDNIKLVAMGNGERKQASAIYKNPIVVLNTTDETKNENEITGDVNITIANSYMMYDLSKINLDEELSAIGFDSSIDSVLKTNVFDEYNHTYSSISHDFIIEFVESIIAVLLIVMMQYVFIKSEMTYKAKEFAIKTSLGYTKTEKYWSVVLIDVAILIVSLIVGIVFGVAIHTEYKYILSAFALITAIDFISIAFFINKVEKAKVVRLIKGAAL